MSLTTSGEGCVPPAEAWGPAFGLQYISCTGCMDTLDTERQKHQLLSRSSQEPRQEQPASIVVPLQAPAITELPASHLPACRCKPHTCLRVG